MTKKYEKVVFTKFVYDIALLCIIFKHLLIKEKKTLLTFCIKIVCMVHFIFVIEKNLRKQKILSIG